MRRLANISLSGEVIEKVRYCPVCGEIMQDWGESGGKTMRGCPKWCSEVVIDGITGGHISHGGRLWIAVGGER